ncbi:MAG: O-antigen ligase family protein [bacterium]|nr:O-antigen ligase family protein [bacterium]
MIARLQKIFLWLLLAPAVAPLIYADGMLYPYMTLKTLLLRGLGIIAAALFVYLISAGVPFFWKRLKEKISWIPGALLVVAYSTSALGVDFYISFWSIFGRGDGLLTLTAIVGFFYLILLSADETFFTKLYAVVAWVGSLVAVHALLQWFEGAGGFSIPFISETGNRLGGTLGNPAFLASYLGLSLFATLLTAHTSSGRYKIILYIGAALQLLVITLTATRGSFLALAVVGIAVLLYINIKDISVKGSTNIKTYARGALVTIVITAALFFAFRAQLSQSPIVPVARVASVSLSDPTVSSRLFLWQSLTQEAFPHALTGVGAEHIAILFDRVYSPDLIVEQWFDRSHNSFLDYFIQFGIFGLLLYCALVASTAYVGWKLFSTQGKDSLPGLALLVITVMYAIQNFFVFDTAVVLWLLVVLFASALATKSDAAPSRLFALPKGEWIGAALALALALLLVPVSIQPLRANMYLADAYVYHVENVARSIDSMQKGFALNTYANLEYGYQAYQMYTGEQLVQLNGAELVEAYQNAKAILEKEFARYPYDARTATYFAHVLDSTPPGVTVDMAKLDQVLAQAIALSPMRSQPWYIKANIFIQQGDSAKTASAKKQAYLRAVDILKEYASRVSTLDEPRYVIASLYLALGDKVSAKQWADEGLSLYKKNGDTAGRAVKYYIAIEDWPHVEQFLQNIVDQYPTDYDSTYDLAKASYLAGDKEKALEIVAQLRIEKPGFVETDPAFLKALGQ